MARKRFNVLAVGIIIIFYFFISLGLFLGCKSSTKEPELKLSNQEEKAVKVEENRIKQHIEKLTSSDFQGRRAGTHGEAEAALYLAQALKNLDLKPLGDKNTYFQSFPLPGMDLRREANRLVFFQKDAYSQLISDNVLGLIESSLRPHEYILLSAHFDHLGVWANELYPGANDNASGVGAILEIARVLKQKEDLPYSVIIAFWGAEEMGLIGSNYFVDNPTIELDKIKFALNLDSIGTGNKNDFLFWSEGPSIVTDAIYNEWQKRQEISLLRQKSSVNTSDHKAIAQGQIPAVTILAADWLKGNHCTQDKAHLLNYEKIVSISQIVFEFLSSLEIVQFFEGR